MKTQEYQVILSFGYIYIVILGILKEAFFYSQLGVDYFQYSTITDILISPLAHIASSITRILVFMVVIFFTFMIPAWLIKYKDKSWLQKSFAVDPSKNLKEIQQHLSRMLTVMLCLGLLGFYLGTGLGGGYKISKKINNKEIEFQDKIVFDDETIDTVYLLGKNNAFLFYLSEDTNEIKITPINGGGVRSIIERK